MPDDFRQLGTCGAMGPTHDDPHELAEDCSAWTAMPTADRQPEPDLLDEAKRLLQKVADTLPRESRMWSLIDTFLQVLKQKPADHAAALRSALISDHRFLPHPFGKDVCDRKLDDHGRVRTCARPREEHGQ